MKLTDLKNNKHLRLTIVLKTNQLRRELSSLTYQHVESTLFGYVWSFKKPDTLSKAVDDVWKLQANEIVAYLSTQAVIQGSQMSIEDFNDLIGGN